MHHLTADPSSPLVGWCRDFGGMARVQVVPGHVPRILNLTRVLT